MSSTGDTPGDIAWRMVADDADFPSFTSYEVLRDTIIEAFNPPDDDVAEEALMTDTLDQAWRFIVAQPCYCKPDVLDASDPCPRCVVLGRAANERLDR